MDDWREHIGRIGRPSWWAPYGSFGLAYYWRAWRWGRKLARSRADVVDVLNMTGRSICSGILVRTGGAGGTHVLVPDHHFISATEIDRDGVRQSAFFVPWPSRGGVGPRS